MTVPAYARHHDEAMGSTRKTWHQANSMNPAIHLHLSPVDHSADSSRLLYIPSLAGILLAMYEGERLLVMIAPHQHMTSVPPQLC